VALVAALAVSYYSAASLLVGRWQNEPEYSHGFLVPVFALMLLWWRRDMVGSIEFRGSLWGLPMLGLAAAIRWGSAYLYFDLLDPASLLPCLLGIALLVGGWPAVRWVWPAVVFLGFMIPLPGFLAGRLSLPLQNLACTTSTYLLQTIGFPAAAQGNQIMLTDAQLGVVEACSGLRMLMTFLAVCTGAAFVLARPIWERLLIVASAVPIAIVSNVVRITATGVLHELSNAKLAEAVYHDFAGWLMMPLALGLLWLELALIGFLLKEPAAKGPLPLGAVGVESPRAARRGRGRNAVSR
jgi:exosortase